MEYPVHVRVLLQCFVELEEAKIKYGIEGITSLHSRKSPTAQGKENLSKFCILPYYSDQTEMFSQKQWLDIPFSAEDVQAAAIRHYRVQSR